MSRFEITRTPISIILPKILGAVKRTMKVRIYLIPRSITFLNPKILGFHFCSKKSLTWTVKCEQLNFRKS